MSFFTKALLACAVGVLIFAANVLAAPNWGELLRKPDAWFVSDDGLRTTTNILSWQSEHGTWPKNTDTRQRPNSAGAANVRGTFDNGATTDELRFLARAFRATGSSACREAVLRGIDGILVAQYPTGGWPQSYPPDDQYHRHITFNDGAMVRLLEFLREVTSGRSFSFVDADRKRAAQVAFDRGVDCILKCQILVDGKLTVWCAQHDEKDYQARSARTYELASLSGAESAGVLGLLMSLDNPRPEIARAIKAGAEWFEAAKLEGIRAVRTNNDRIVLSDPAAPPLWARFYEIGSNRPIFSGRDGVKKYNLAEIEQERRRGYAWYGNWGEKVARDFAQWRERWPQAAATAGKPTTSTVVPSRSSPIDRHALVVRHNPSLRRYDVENPLSVAMCAARVGEPDRAVDALLLDTPKNRYRLNGHNHQRPGLTLYLPGNGGLLYATAMMAAGWDGAPEKHAPGFPDNGQWVVRWENLRRAP